MMGATGKCIGDVKLAVPNRFTSKSLLSRPAKQQKTSLTLMPPEPAGKSGENEPAVGPGQGSRLVLAPCAQGTEEEGDGREEDAQAWVEKQAQCVPITPLCDEAALCAARGAVGDKLPAGGIEELGVAIKGSPFFTFLGRVAPSSGEKVGATGTSGGLISPGGASVVRLQARTASAGQEVYTMGVQVAMGAKALYRTMYITLVPRTVTNTAVYKARARD